MLGYAPAPSVWLWRTPTAEHAGRTSGRRATTAGNDGKGELKPSRGSFPATIVRNDIGHQGGRLANAQEKVRAGDILGGGVVVPLMYLSPLHARVTGKYPGARSRTFAAASLVAAGAVLALLLSSCSTSATYAGSASQDVFFKLPRSWTVYNQTTLQNMGLVNATQTSQAQAQGSSYQLFVTFASPNPHLGAHGGPDLSGSSPWAYNFVESLGGSDQESLSLGGLKNLVLPIDTLSQQGAAKQLAPTRQMVDGDLRGTRVAYEAKSQGGSVAFDQVALMNSPTNKVWVLAVGCSLSCFQTHRSTIDNIVKTFTVTGQGH